MNVYEVITAEIVKKLKAGVIPWQKPYLGIEYPAVNFKSKKAYRGINQLTLGMAGYASPYWLTYKQAEELGGKVKKGSKGSKIMFAKMIKYEDPNGTEKDRAIYRYSNVFNLTMIEGIECPFKDKQPEPHDNNEFIENCEQAVNQMKEKGVIPQIIEHDRAIAFYQPFSDTINTPPIEGYVGSEEYYSTLFHEIIHSTGHESRLNRNLKGGKTSIQYAKEELVAEIGACFLCAKTGITTKTIDNSASYIKGWLSCITEDPKLIISASSKAQKAVDYLGIEILIPEEHED